MDMCFLDMMCMDFFHLVFGVDILYYQLFSLLHRITDPHIRELILETAKDEGRHGAVFHNLTDATLKPKKTKAIVVPCLMSILGKRKTFEIIAGQEYSAETKYDEIVGKYPTVVSVQKDEHMHGNRMMEISKKF